ncbi:hypothetical protein EO763_23170 (plasmid) [Pectobacterium odoriferum]|uniref:hypothetical protein n=1 Tax=Pectobacterium odoriferum TaxID=78398 RepID=UPI0013742D38|nr:hypothetical protein [Pectobacterium odoriferum]QHP82797.1 hypothetical protein EO763_23170 [Pectobacterium odoriferum]
MENKKQEVNFAVTDLDISSSLVKEVKKNSSFNVLVGIMNSLGTSYLVSSGCYVLIGVSNVYLFYVLLFICFIVSLFYFLEKENRELTEKEIECLYSCSDNYREALFKYIKDKNNGFLLTWVVISEFNKHCIKNINVNNKKINIDEHEKKLIKILNIKI